MLLTLIICHYKVIHLQNQEIVPNLQNQKIVHFQLIILFAEIFGNPYFIFLQFLDLFQQFQFVNLHSAISNFSIAQLLFC